MIRLFLWYYLRIMNYYKGHSCVLLNRFVAYVIARYRAVFVIDPRLFSFVEHRQRGWLSPSHCHTQKWAVPGANPGY